RTTLVRTDRRLRSRLPLGGDEEVQLVLDDRAAEVEAVLIDFEIAVAEKWLIRRHVRIAIGPRRSALQLVRAALRDGVDEHAGEVAVAHVRGREEHLELLHRVDRDQSTRDGASGNAAGRSQVEPV